MTEERDVRSCPDSREHPFPSAKDEAESVARGPKSAQTASPSYRLAYDDRDFLLRDELRPVRLQLELLKADLIQSEHGIHSTVVLFGSARIPDKKTAEQRLVKAEAEARRNPSDPVFAQRAKIARRIMEKCRYYDEARHLARIITERSTEQLGAKLVVVTGGGPGIMEAANRGAYDRGGESVGLNIILPTEQCPNPYITPELCFQFHYFAIRKMHFLMRAKALVAFPGGFGTLDELFDTLTLMQTKKVRPVPVLLVGRQYWDRIIHFEAMVEEGTIAPEELELLQFVETAEEAWEKIRAFYGQHRPEAERLMENPGDQSAFNVKTPREDSGR